MQRPLEQIVAGRQFDDPPDIHDRDPVADMPDDAQIVGDEDETQFALLLQIDEQVQDLRLYRHVKRRDAFVGDDHPRFQRQGAGDADCAGAARR